MMQKQVAFMVIGDEILSGRTQDVNVQVLAQSLASIGARLAEVRMIPDDEDVIVECIHALTARYDYVFSSGGIGPTHDDITADCVAKAFGLGIDVRADARKILGTNYANGEADLNAARLRMARIPDGARLIANPISKAPGFQVENLFVCAGVPSIFAVMLDDALPRIETGAKLVERSHILDMPESRVATPLSEVAKKYPALSIGSYPQEENGRYFSEIVVRGFDAGEVDRAIVDVAEIAGG